MDSVPSPYARLNQLTLEMLAGYGRPDQVARLLAMVKQAEQVCVVGRGGGGGGWGRGGGGWGVGDGCVRRVYVLGHAHAVHAGELSASSQCHTTNRCELMCSYPCPVVSCVLLVGHSSP